MFDIVYVMGGVRVSEHDGVLVVRIDRPEVRNALNLEVAAGIRDAADLLDARPDLRVGVLTGEGGVFSAGMDLKAAAEGERPTFPGRGLCGIAQAPPVKPLVAAVEGWAVGGGFELALACDLVVAAQDAKFALPEVKRGLMAAGGGALRLASLLPRARALELLLTGDPMTADEAWRLGLVNRVTVKGEALAGALELAARIAANAPLAVVASKDVCLSAPSWLVAGTGWDDQQPVVDRVFGSSDAAEGAAAFLERRTPAWTGE
jgi:enoyl-CoA hydratase